MIGRAGRSVKFGRLPSRTGKDSASLPQWLTAAVNEWATISGTTGGAQFDFYSGMALRDDGDRVELCVAAAGGHNGGGVWDRQNRVQSIRLDASSPSWTTREADSDSTGWDGTATPGTEYFPSDNAPVPRHLYDSIQWMPQLGCYLIGGTFAGNNAQIGVVEQRGYVPSGDSAGAWAARATYPDLPGFHHLIAAYNSENGDCFGRYLYGTQAFKISGATGAWSSFSLSGDTTTLAEGGMAYDTTRDRVVQICGSGWFTQGGTTTPRCVWIDWATGVKTAITFNSSSAYTDFSNNCGKFVGSALVYAANLDCFFFYNGNTGSPALTGQAAKVYKITPNYGGNWDMEILSVTGVTPTAGGGGIGVYNKFRYIERWSALVLPSESANLNYLRVA